MGDNGSRANCRSLKHVQFQQLLLSMFTGCHTTRLSIRFQKWVCTRKLRFCISGIELVSSIICFGYTHFQGRCDFFLLCSTFWNMIILSASLGYAWLSSIRWHKSAIRMNNTNIVFSLKTFFLFNWQCYGIDKKLWISYWYCNFCMISTQIWYFKSTQCSVTLKKLKNTQRMSIDISSIIVCASSFWPSKSFRWSKSSLHESFHSYYFLSFILGSKAWDLHSGVVS